MTSHNPWPIVTITNLTTAGEGLAYLADGRPLIVKGAIPKDQVEVQLLKRGPKQDIGRIRRLLVPSPDRCDPPCPLAEKCGACQLMMMRYEAQLKWKRDQVMAALEKYDLSLPVASVLGMKNPWHYRNKTLLPLGYTAGGHYVAGFYGERSHRLIAQDNCLLSTPKAAKIVKTILAFLEKGQISLYSEQTGRGLVRHLLIREARGSGEVLVSLIVNGRRLPQSERLVAALKALGVRSISLCVNTAKGNAVLGQELIPLYGPLYIEEKIGALNFRLGPRSFFQINGEQTEVLYQVVVDFAELSGRETVWDLYCGTGTIALFLARYAKAVLGVEIIGEATENARQNARLNNILNADFYVGKAEEVVPKILDKPGAAADVVVVDPPRKGCDQGLLATICQMAPAKIIYVSCNPLTLARDLAFLHLNGLYQIKKVQPVDMFPMTSHVETVCLLSK